MRRNYYSEPLPPNKPNNIIIKDRPLTNTLVIMIILVMVIQSIVLWGLMDTKQSVESQVRGMYASNSQFHQEIYWLISDLNQTNEQHLTIMPETNQYIDDLKFFESAVERFGSNHHYELGVYDCQNYSEDFHTTMSELGFDVQEWRGKNLNESKGHQYNKVCFDVEPQGKLKDISYEKEYLWRE